MNLPSYSAPSQRQLQLRLVRSFEFARASASSALPTETRCRRSDSAQPQLTVFSTPPATLQPTVEVRLNSDYYWLPTGENVSPPGLGSTRQWFLQQGYRYPCAYGATPA